MSLTNNEFTLLLNAHKKFKDEKIQLPSSGESKRFDILCTDRREKLFLDVNRSGRIEINKSTLQHRYVEPLIRIDLDSPPHTNPDGTKTSRNHIHVYKEGYGDSWAYDLDKFKGFKFNTVMNFSNIFIDICGYCNIEMPEIQVSM